MSAATRLKMQFTRDEDLRISGVSEHSNGMQVYAEILIQGF